MDDLTECIITHVAHSEWGSVWLELRDYQGQVSPGLVKVVASHHRTAYQRAHYYRLDNKQGRWVRRVSLGVSRLDWLCDKPIYHLFEVRDELPQYEEHLGPDRWDHIKRRIKDA